MNNYVQALNISIKDKDIKETIQYLCNDHKDKVVFSTSFSMEDQIITHLIFSNQLPVRVFTLDTGRMYTETYKVFSKTIEKYNQPIEVYFPDNKDIEKLMTEKGPFSFYNSVENRKECCFYRKIKPLKRALKGSELWITGLRAEQSENRSKINIIEWDDENKIIKYNPLIHWNTIQIREYIKINQIPYNILHDQGFPSIGCQPCTRKVNEGESIRSGRWWWENNSKKECGLHS
jgi:phosphoadenosine phosphosulfate reductase